MTIPQMKPYRRRGPSVRWAIEALAQRGIALTPERVRAYAGLLIPPVETVPMGQQMQRAFREEDIDRLEALIVLKGLGFTNEEVQRWFREPNEASIRARLAQVKSFVTRAGALLESVKDEASLADGVFTPQAPTSPSAAPTEGQPATHEPDGPATAHGSSA